MDRMMELIAKFNKNFEPKESASLWSCNDCPRVWVRGDHWQAWLLFRDADDFSDWLDCKLQGRL